MSNFDFLKMKKELRYKIRMTMGVYENIVDLEKESHGEKEQRKKLTWV